MAVAVSGLVWSGYTGPGGSEMLVLLALADWADDQGECWPSIAAIGKKVRLQERRVQCVLRNLIDGGWVSVVGNSRGGAPGSTRRYRIVVERLATGALHDTPTGALHDTPRVSTGALQALRRVHSSAPKPSLTVIEKKAANHDSRSSTPKSKAASKPANRGVTFGEYLRQCNAEGVKAIPDGHAIRRYAADIGLDDEMLTVAWFVFRDRHLTDPGRRGKRQKDWPATFANAVKDGWYRL